MYKLIDTCDSIIFDLDGTLWDATETTLSTWPIVFEKYPNIKPAFEMTLENITKYMGLNNEELGEVFFPNQSKEMQTELMKASCDLENNLLWEKGGKLFDGVKETLENLCKKYPLFIVSNCQAGYIECFLHAHRFESTIKDFECSGNTGLSKAENIKLICERNGLKNPVYVGDTTSDSNACIKADILFIYARYGFGERDKRGKVDNYTYYIDAIKELNLL